MINLFCCFERKLSEEELRKINLERMKMLPLYNKLKQSTEKYQ